MLGSWVNLLQSYTRKYAVLFVNSYFQIHVKLDTLEIPPLKTQVHILNY